MVQELCLLLGSSTFHYGIDIAATPGANLIAVTSGKITYTDFNGANGYTIKLESFNLTFSYSHVNPNFIVSIGDYVYKGQIIGNVGPKYVQNIPNNPYKDSTGKSTNGATTGAHLHFSIKKSNEYINPLDLLTNNI